MTRMPAQTWPTPATGQVLCCHRPYTEGWASGYWWPVEGGFHYVIQWMIRPIRGHCIEDAWTDPLNRNWFEVLGKTHGLTGRATKVKLIPSATLLPHLEGWRAEILARSAARWST